MPETIPVEEPIAAMDGPLLLQVPLPTSVSVIPEPWQTEDGPEIVMGKGFTVTTVVIKQPAGSIYVILAEPAATAVRMPVVEPMIATAWLSLLQLPPETVLPKADADPVHKSNTPVITPGNAFTVTIVVTVQPVPSVYVITDVPDVSPSTTPDKEPIDTFVLLLLHAPPPASVSVTELPVHNDNGPVMGDGNETTVTVVIAIQPVGKV